MIRYGTHHFVTADAARRYYKGQGDADCFGPGWIKRIDEKIQAGEIAIGKPPLPPGANGPNVSPIKQQVGETTTREAE